jgi:DNA-binding HxlR family transcriptional regulator
MHKGLQRIREAATAPRTAALLDVAGRRWALRVVWELRRGALNFRELRDACGGVSPGVLQSRLNELRAADVVERVPGLGYRLTVRGEELFQLLAPLSQWAESGSSVGDKKD